MIEVISCEQGTPEWRQARLGIPSASNFATIMAKGRNGGDSVTRRKYLFTLAGEIITGEPAESYSNGFMERGKVMEAEARDWYAFMMDAEPEQVGFIRDARKQCGCSPDSLLGDKGMLEIKTHAPHILIEHIFGGEFPSEHRTQTQGQLWVADREWVDLVLYYTNMPPIVHRAYRDDAYISQIASAVAQFNEELRVTVEKIRAYGSREVRNAA